MRPVQVATAPPVFWFCLLFIYNCQQYIICNKINGLFFFFLTFNSYQKLVDKWRFTQSRNHFFPGAKKKTGNTCEPAVINYVSCPRHWLLLCVHLLLSLTRHHSEKKKNHLSEMHEWLPLCLHTDHIPEMVLNSWPGSTDVGLRLPNSGPNTKNLFILPTNIQLRI